CGDCEPTCSRGLPLASMFRDAYIWNYGNETFMADERENYFALHPFDALACATCETQSCRCPQGLRIPGALAELHGTMRTLRAAGKRPDATNRRQLPDRRAPHQVCVLSADIVMSRGELASARFVVENTGTSMWTAECHVADPRVALAVGVVVDGVFMRRSPIRQNVCPGQRSPVVLEFEAPPDAGPHRLDFHLLPLDASGIDARATRFHSTTVHLC
ncbi:MAG TPA: hypothetical protein VFZ98_01050, partial [Vicinamibacterales bacterium]